MTRSVKDWIYEWEENPISIQDIFKKHKRLCVNKVHKRNVNVNEVNSSVNLLDIQVWLLYQNFKHCTWHVSEWNYVQPDKQIDERPDDPNTSTICPGHLVQDTKIICITNTHVRIFCNIL